jgi:hypothetical protein
VSASTSAAFYVLLRVDSYHVIFTATASVDQTQESRDALA